jgi:tetratricopeptide (TPR) repeat protein
MLKSLRLAAMLLMVCGAQAQDHTVDSLQALLQKPKLHDTTRVRLMTDILDYYLQTGYAGKEPYTAKLKSLLDNKLSQRQLGVKEQKAYKLALGTWYYHQAAKIFTKDNAAQVIRYFDLAIPLFKEAGAEDDQWAIVMNKGMILRKINRPKEAFDCYFAALKHYEQKNDLSGIAQVNTAIGLSHQELSETPKAIKYYEKSAAYYAGIKKPSSSDLYDQMILLGNLAVAYKDENQPEKARKLFYQAIALAEKVGNTDNIGAGWRGLADMDLTEKNYEEAIKKYQKGMLVSQGPEQTAYLQMGLWEAYFKTNRIAEAKKYLLECQANAELANEPRLLSNVYGDLYLTYKALKDYKKALEMYEKHKKMKESLGMESAKDELKQQQLKYAFEKRELNYKLATQKKNAAKNIWLIVLSGALLLIVSGGYFFYRNSRQKQSIATLERNQIKQKLLITQMNPHFIFNSVQNIRNLINNHQNNDAVKYLDQFSVLTRQILENSNENYISLDEEVAMIQNYLSIQQLLYNHKFDFSIFVQDEIETDSTFLPPMLTQPFIENAIKHGLSNRDANGKIEVKFFLESGKLFFEVTDNGKGFDASKTFSNHKSLAMTITKERLVGYTKNQDFVVQTHNIKDQDENVVGAKVSFEIPYIYEN